MMVSRLENSGGASTARRFDVGALVDTVRARELSCQSAVHICIPVDQIEVGEMFAGNLASHLPSSNHRYSLGNR